MQTSPPKTIPETPRDQWPRCLLALEPGEVQRLASELCKDVIVEDVQLPQSGLALMSLRDSALGDVYFPGEVPLSTAQVNLKQLDGTVAEGAAQLLDDRSKLARAVAIIDAAVSGKVPGHTKAFPVLNKGFEKLQEEASVRKAFLARTRVDFTLLGNEEMDDD